MPSRAQEMSQRVNHLASALYGRNGGGPPDEKKGGPGMFLACSFCPILYPNVFPGRIGGCTGAGGAN